MLLAVPSVLFSIIKLSRPLRGNPVLFPQGPIGHPAFPKRKDVFVSPVISGVFRRRQRIGFHLFNYSSPLFSRTGTPL